jgi:AraC-like DNA-binding protein
VYGKSERFEDYEDSSHPLVMATSLAAGSARAMPAMRRQCILLVDTGVIAVRLGASNWVCAAGTALSVPSGRTAELIAQGTSRVLAAFFVPSRKSAAGVQRVVATDLVRALVQALAELPHPTPPSMRSRRLGRLLADELCFIESTPIQLPWPREPRLIRLCDSVQSDLSRTMPLPEAAAIAGMSLRTLSRRFVQETGMSLAQWQRAARLTVALTEVAKGESIYSAAAASGFGTASSLCATFKRVTGTTLHSYFRYRRNSTVLDEQQFFAAR